MTISRRSGQPPGPGDPHGAAAGLPAGWSDALAAELAQPYWRQLQDYVDRERDRHPVYPAPDDVFTAFRLTPLPAVRVVILGQDPYFNPGLATGLAFSVPDAVTAPPSLRTILGELRADLGITRPHDLTGWARQGVLLLNTVLTVRGGQPNSHRGRGWERFTNAVISEVSRRQDRVVFILWGGPARSKRSLIDTSKHAVLESAHPAAYATAKTPLRGSRPFSRANSLLSSGVDWSAS